MGFFKLFIYFLILLYVSGKQQLYSSAVKYKRPDQRVVILQNYLFAKKSPLAPSANKFIQVADKYKLDWKLLPAIAGVESGFEKAGNINDFNPFGYMCGSSPCVFDSFEDAIKTVAKTISGSGTYARHRKTGSIRELAIKYNYVSPDDWTEKIEYFRGKLK